jgi:hypothetical protein
MRLVGRLIDLVDAVITGRPPRVIDREFSWLREMSLAVAGSGWRGMETYVTYASQKVLVRVLDEYHYGWVGIWLARAPTPDGGPAGPDVPLDQLVAARAPHVRWDGNYDGSVSGARHAKLAEGARLLRDHCGDLLRGTDLELLDALGGAEDRS